MSKLSRLFLSIEGNIGTGKSTFIDLLQKNMNQQKPHLKSLFEKEPVSDWQSIPSIDNSSVSPVNLLEMFYNDPQRYGYTFQSYAFFSRLRTLHQQLSSLNHSQKTLDCFITERCILSDKHIFAENSFRAGFLSEAEKRIYDNWFQFLNEVLGQSYNAHIYLRCQPEVSHQRVMQRSRKGEQGIPLEYLQSLHQRHEEWLGAMQNKVLILNVDQDFLKDLELQENIVEQSVQFVCKQII